MIPYLGSEGHQPMLDWSQVVAHVQTRELTNVAVYWLCAYICPRSFYEINNAKWIILMTV